MNQDIALIVNNMLLCGVEVQFFFNFNAMKRLINCRRAEPQHGNTGSLINPTNLINSIN